MQAHVVAPFLSPPTDLIQNIEREAAHVLASPSLIIILLTLLAGVLVFILALRYPTVGLVVIISSVAVPGWSGEVYPADLGIPIGSLAASLTLRSEYVFVPVVSAALLFKKLYRKERIRIGRAPLFGIWLAANVVSSWLVSTDQAYSFRMLYFHFVGGLGYLWAMNFVVDRAGMSRALRVAAIVVIIEAGYSIFFSGRWFDKGVIRLYGSLLEPVILADYTVPLAILLFSWASKRYFAAGAWKLPAAAGVAAATMGILTFSRAAWLTLTAGLLLLLVYWRAWGLLRSKHVIVLATSGLFAAVGIVLVWTTAAVAPLIARLGDQSANMRLTVAQQVISELKASPWVGFGTLTYGLGHPMYGLSTGPGWIPSGLLNVVHDTGVVGLSIFLAFVGLLLLDAYRATKVRDTALRHISAGSLAGMLAWLVMDQFSSSMILGFTWVFIGLTSAIVTLALDEQGHSANNAERLSIRRAR